MRRSVSQSGCKNNSPTNSIELQIQLPRNTRRTPSCRDILRTTLVVRGCCWQSCIRLPAYEVRLCVWTSRKVFLLLNPNLKLLNSHHFQNRTCTNGALSCNVVGLCCEISSRNDVVIKQTSYLNLSCLKLRVRWVRSFIRICSCFELRSISAFSSQTLSHPVQVLHQTQFHDCASHVMLAMPRKFRQSRLVVSETEWNALKAPPSATCL